MVGGKRKLRKKRYVAAIIITFVIFVLGFILGAATSERKIFEIEQLSRQQDADFSSLQFQFSYLESVPREQSCVVLSRTLESNLKTLGPSLKKLEGYEASSDTTNPDYILLKRKYTVANLRYWLLAEKSKQLCGTDAVSVLYFYEKGCQQCNDEGYILEQLKQRLGDSLLVFPIDASIDEPVIDILRAQYKIYGFPSLVIDGKTYANYMPMKEILAEICPKYKEGNGVCGG
ncbi:MAG: hypothetical protein HY516_04725 [Candidatus Aenigmarchaeota archaeon]|nr:hypothetical protein [Candidatus Aenigmarchaeota archaeon]